MAKRRRGDGQPKVRVGHQWVRLTGDGSEDNIAMGAAQDAENEREAREEGYDSYDDKISIENIMDDD